jgi:hypothetical protein
MLTNVDNLWISGFWGIYAYEKTVKKAQVAKRHNAPIPPEIGARRAGCNGERFAQYRLVGSSLKRPSLSASSEGVNISLQFMQSKYNYTSALQPLRE